MIYIRKTRDVFDIEQFTGSQYGWEVVSCEETRKEARQRAQEYRENQPEYPVRIKSRREKIADYPDELRDADAAYRDDLAHGRD